MKRNTNWLLLIFLMTCFYLPLQAQQRGVYTVLQAGGMFGVSATNDQSTMYGYQFQVVFGRNFYDRMYLGIGLGNDVYRGRSSVQVNGSRSSRRINTLPIYADFRVPFAGLSPVGTFGILADAGYAPSIGADFFKGFVGKAGITYSLFLAEGSDLQFSAGYGIQQFDSRFSGNAYSQHNVFITVGLFVH